jgi:hypothetical protein
MISHKLNTVFVHIPKCAGTAVEHALLPYTEGASNPDEVLIRQNRNPLKGPPWLQHLTASEYISKGYIGNAKWKKSYTFAVVRNPFARLVSEYNAKGKTWKMKLLGLDWNFRNFVIKCLPSWFEDNYLRGNDNYRHILPQHRFVYDRSGSLLVNDVYKLEELSKRWPTICQKLDLPDISLPRQNISKFRSPDDGTVLLDKKPNLDEYYGDETVDLVIRHYRKDFEHFGYDREPANK